MAFDKNKTSLGMKIVIIGFAVILVASLCLPFFSGCSNAAGPAPDGAPSDQTGSEQQPATVAQVQQQYQTLLDSLKERREANPDNLTYAASLGNNYMDCGITMKGASDAADNEQLIAETFAQAVAYYDEYLQGAEGDDTVTDGDVSAVTVDRAVCLFYAGSEDEAVSELEAFLEGEPDFAMGWYNLGAFHEQMGDTAKAKEAYNTAIEKDPDNEAGAGSYAQLRLLILEAAEQAAEEEAEDDASDADTDAPADADADADKDAAADNADADAPADAEKDAAADADAPADADDADKDADAPADGDADASK